MGDDGMPIGAMLLLATAIAKIRQDLAARRGAEAETST